MKSVTIHFDKLYKNNLSNEYSQVTIPFAKGELPEQILPTLGIVSSDSASKPVPVQFLPVSRWADGSIRFLFIRFLADVPGNSRTDYVLKEALQAKTSLTVTETPYGYNVNTGVLQASVSSRCEHLFETITVGSRTYEAAQFEGPFVTVNQTPLPLVIDRWTVAEAGSVMVILEGFGHCGENRCNVRLFFTAGKPWVETAVRLFNDSLHDLIPDSWVFYLKRTPDSIVSADLPHIEKAVDSTGCGDLNKTEIETRYIHTTGTRDLAQIEADLNCPEGIRTFSGISNYRTRFTISGTAAPTAEEFHAEDHMKEANEHFAEVFFGTFMADVTDPDGGICATIFQAQQNYPKAICAERGGLAVHLIPEGDEKVVFSSGMAREQKFLLHFHDNSTTIEELDDRSLIYQMPMEPWVDPMVFAEAAVMPDIFTKQEQADAEAELGFMQMADGHGRAYGMMNWGDFPDPNYTAQGRGGGKLVWTNNEYDYPHGMFCMYARSGIRRFLDYAKVSAFHWMDVDICHWNPDPLINGGQWEHINGHNGGSADGNGPKGVLVCSHEWVEGLIDLWHFTGERRALESAVGIGENVLRLLETPMYQKAGEANARETGWALRTLMALYVETNDEHWLSKTDFILNQFRQWHELYGAWLSPYTDNTVIRVGFMISVAVGSLIRYYRVFPKEEIKTMILNAVDDLTESFMNPYGLFYYKELPSLQRNGNNTLLLEAMYIGYELTGDSKYLKYGLGTFHNKMDSMSGFKMSKRCVEDAVLTDGAPTKMFAQSFLPTVQYYNALIKSGLLKH